MGKGNSAIVIRPEKPQDYAGVHELNRLAFRRESEARLIENLRATSGFIPELSLVAIGGKNVVGHVLFYPISIETPDGDLPALAMAPMAVRPELKKEDISGRLMQQGTRECRRLGYKCIVTMGAQQNYRELGFAPIKWGKLKHSLRVSGGDLMVLELVPGLLDDVRGTVKFPPVFTELWGTATF